MNKKEVSIATIWERINTLVPQQGYPDGYRRRGQTSFSSSRALAKVLAPLFGESVNGPVRELKDMTKLEILALELHYHCKVKCL